MWSPLTATMGCHITNIFAHGEPRLIKRSFSQKTVYPDRALTNIASQTDAGLCGSPR
jgi:hypothetical protein